MSDNMYYYLKRFDAQSGSDLEHVVYPKTIYTSHLNDYYLTKMFCKLNLELSCVSSLIIIIIKIFL